MPPTIKKPAGEEDPAREGDSRFDAKQHLELTLHREPGDTLKIFPMQQRGTFRVNWYAQRPSESTTIAGLNILYIRESKFLYCRLNAQGQPEISYPATQ